MTWWCSSTSQPWSWTWQPYVGVWVLVALLLGWYLTRARPRAGRDTALFGAGVLVLWLANDWPIGALAGYLATLHTVQYILISLVAAPLLLLGLPAAWLETRGAGVQRLLREGARAWVGLVVFNAILFVTHLPGVIDALRPSQLGSFAMDMAWLVGGAALWWPVVAPAPWRRLSGPLRILYLFVSTIPPTIPAAFLTFADYPVYAVYELAPRVEGITAATDQQAAGVLMKALADPVVWIAMAIVFFRWQAAEERADRASRSGRTAASTAV